MAEIFFEGVRDMRGYPEMRVTNQENSIESVNQSLFTLHYSLLTTHQSPITNHQKSTAESELRKVVRLGPIGDSKFILHNCKPSAIFETIKERNNTLPWNKIRN